ncbi:ABC transporter permease [Paenibacillus lutrae]|uniref:FtsX-like permease family protein n=1 Tax=Paenibacillus lutrae TaxID=2078573 RepID=A0A7X3FME9_9BACL|nr:FtsX-like permease family protein [Paenibacillus lutrae]MVP02420.1 FtsX-like permease family protein [Paenibacillus lutrae]
MMKLFVKLLRDIKQSLGQFMALVLIIAVGAFFYAGLVTYSDKLSAYTKAYFQEHNLSDLNVYYKQITKDDVADLSGIEGITKIEERYTFDAVQVFEDYKASLKIHSIPVQNEINTLFRMEGRIPAKKDEIFVDSRYANEHQYRVGDQIRISANEKDFTFTISALGENVEHVKKNETQDHKTYGVAYIAEEAIPLIAGSLSYNELIIDAAEGTDIDQLGKTVEAQTKHLTYLDQVSKERSFAYSKINQTIQNNGLMSKVVPFVLFLISAVILFLTMSMIIDSQRNQVGIMKALGIKDRNIMLHYMGYPVLAGIAGSLLGSIVAAFVFIPFVTTSSARSFSLPDVTYSLSIFSFLPPILFSSAFGLLSCYLSGRKILKERAAQAMRPKPPKTMKKIWIERIPGLWTRISYSYKLILRNIFLNKQKALVSSVGIVVSTALLITALGTQSALLKVAGQVEDVYSYDLRVDYTRGTSFDSIKRPSGISNRYDLAAFPVEFLKDGNKEKATLVVTEKENNLIHFFDEHDKKLFLENHGVLVPKSYADKYQIAEGDTIQVKFTAPELDNKTIDMNVLHISTQYSNPAFYSTPAYLKSFDINYSPTSLLVEAESPQDLANVRAYFEQDPQVDTITDKNDLKKSAQYIVNQNSFVFIMFIICAIVLSFGAIYTISSINIYERNRELATLKVLGYQKYKINRLIFFENIILTTFAVVVALPISGYMYTNVVKALSSSHQQIPDQLNIFILLISVLLAFFLTIVSNLLLRRKVANISMIESLKSIE